ncbi:MAG: ABC transporter ATP-binding protein [Microcoleaceae cyanobacterium]
MTNAVELINVSKSFKGSQGKRFTAVNQMHLQIQTGEFFSLLGPSGCGKTTTLRMIAGFEAPTSGEIYIHGNLMNNCLPFHRPVNTVFQNYALFPHLNIFQNVAFGLEMENRPKSQIKDRVKEALSLVKLTDFERRYPSQLSGGQQQRVALARALVKQPKVLLFDEPLGALDLKLRKQMQLELKQMQQKLGITFVYVTHDQEEALTMSDRIGVMQDGVVLQVGSPIDIYEYPKTRFVADFIGESNFLTGEVQEKQGENVSVAIDKTLIISAKSTDELFPKQQVTLAIRPEKVRVYPSNQNSIQAFLGKIEEIIYIGTDIRYLVRISLNSCLVIRQQNLHRDDIQRYSIGESVQVVISPDNISILQDR